MEKQTNRDTKRLVVAEKNSEYNKKKSKFVIAMTTLTNKSQLLVFLSARLSNETTDTSSSLKLIS